MVQGRVLHEDGSPAAGAFVRRTGGPDHGSVTTAAVDGRFELEVPLDGPVPVPVLASPTQPDMKRPLTGYDLLDGTDRELEIVLRPVPRR